MYAALQILNINKTQQHPFHVMHSSKLPMFISFFAGCTALLFVTKLHAGSGVDSLSGIFVISQLVSPLFEADGMSYFSLNMLIILGLLSGVITMGSWSFNLLKEAGGEGRHTFRVQLALKYGMLLFLVSEAMLFFPFF
jgi:hypothetical protein